MAEPVQFNPLLPEVVADPYPTYHRLRAEDPVHLSPTGVWFLTRYDDAAMILRDPRFGKRGYQQLLTARFGREGLGRSMLFQDPPAHAREQGLHPARDRGYARPHPANRGPPAGRREG